MKVIAIGGEPGSGKTTLMKNLIEKYKPEPKYNSFKLVPYLQKDNIYILGKYEDGEVFSGTDRMSMAVQPEVIKFLDFLPKDSIIMFEGDRLFTSSFLEHCVDNFDTKIIHLMTSKSVREERYKLRGSKQNETWLAVVLAHWHPKESTPRPRTERQSAFQRTAPLHQIRGNQIPFGCDRVRGGYKYPHRYSLFSQQNESRRASLVAQTLPQ